MNIFGYTPSNVGSSLPSTGGTLTGNLNMAGNAVTNAKELILASNVAPDTPPASGLTVYTSGDKLRYTDNTTTAYEVATVSSLGSYLPVAGGTMTGDILTDASTHDIGSVGTPFQNVYCQNIIGPVASNSKASIYDSHLLVSGTVESSLFQGSDGSTGTYTFAANTTSVGSWISGYLDCYIDNIGAGVTLTFNLKADGNVMGTYAYTSGAGGANVVHRIEFSACVRSAGGYVVVFMRDNLDPTYLQWTETEGVWNTALPHDIDITGVFSSAGPNMSATTGLLQVVNP